MNAAQLFAPMAWNNAWANHRLFGACRALQPGEFTAPRVSFFPSISATLNHNLIVDWFYVDALERSLGGQPLNAHALDFFADDNPHPDVTPLEEAQRAVDRRLVAVCQGLSDVDPASVIRVPRVGRVQEDTLFRLLHHVFQHQIHHRGQAHAMLAGTSVKPPQLDEFYSAAEAPLRAEDFAALGVDEATVWGTIR